MTTSYVKFLILLQAADEELKLLSNGIEIEISINVDVGDYNCDKFELKLGSKYSKENDSNLKDSTAADGQTRMNKDADEWCKIQ